MKITNELKNDAVKLDSKAHLLVRFSFLIKLIMPFVLES